METTRRGYRARLINFDGILLDGVFSTITEAIAAARKTIATETKTWEGHVYTDGKIVGSKWSTLTVDQQIARLERWERDVHRLHLAIDQRIAALKASRR